MRVRISKKIIERINKQKIKPFSSFTFGVKRGDGDAVPSLIVKESCSVLEGVEESITYSLYAVGKHYGFVCNHRNVTTTNFGYRDFESFFSIVADYIDSYLEKDYNTFFAIILDIKSGSGVSHLETKCLDIDYIRNELVKFQLAHRKICTLMINPTILEQLSKNDGRIRSFYFNINVEQFANLIINDNKNYNFVMAKLWADENLDGECQYNELLNDRLYISFNNLYSAVNGTYKAYYGVFDKKVNDPTPIDNPGLKFIMDNNLRPSNLEKLGESGYLIDLMWRSILGDVNADKELCDPIIRFYTYGLTIEIDKENKQVEVCTNTRDLRNYKYDENNNIVKCLMDCYVELSTLDKLRVIISLKQLKKCVNEVDKIVKNQS